jgi:L-lactate dehydrogenase complex protein LldF
MSSPTRFAAAERAGRVARLGRRGGRPFSALPPPLSAWTGSRDLPAPPEQTFREWWEEREGR